MPLKINNESNEISYNNFVMLDDITTLRIRNYKKSDILNYLKRVGVKDNMLVVERATYDLLRTCVHPDDISTFENLDRPNILNLIILLRAYSKSDRFPYPYQCPHCKTTNPDYSLTIKDSIKYKYNVDKTLVFGDYFSIKLQNIPYAKELELALLEDEDLKAKYDLYYRIQHIQTGDEIVDRSMFTVDEFHSWLECEPDDYHLTIEQMDMLLNKVNSTDEFVELSRTDYCVACGGEVHISVDNFTFFIMA